MASREVVVRVTLVDALGSIAPPLAGMVAAWTLADDQSKRAVRVTLPELARELDGLVTGLEAMIGPIEELAEYEEALKLSIIEGARRAGAPSYLVEPEPEPGPRYTAPAPPPAELGFDLAKWNRMSRAERRAVLRYAKKQGEVSHE
jgi:predicted Fe-S protein YdhL (DUF1289 family)